MKLQYLAAILIAVSMAPALAQQQPVDEVQVNVLPKKGLKFDPKAIYHDDQAVLQGIFGTSGDDVVNDLEVLPSREIIAVGRMGAPAEAPAAFPRGLIQGVSTTGNAFAAVFNPAFRKLEKLVFLPGDVSTLDAVRPGPDGALYFSGLGMTAGRCFVIKMDAGMDRILWRIDLPGGAGDSLVVMKDNSVVVHVMGPFIAHIKPDGSGLMPWGSQPYFRIDRANPGIQQKYWVGLGYEAKGFHEQSFLAGGLSDLGLTPDGNLVIMACNSIRDPNGSPDFDPMLVKFTTAGEVLWAKNLVDGIPSEPDQKNPRLYVDPASGDLILAMNQHGSFGPGHDLVVSPGCYQTDYNWFTGDVFLGWIGRVDSMTGELKAGTMYFPDMGKPPKSGKSFANSLFPEVVRTDAQGNIYTAGAAAYKLATTTNAFQPEPLGGNAFLTVFDPKLGTIIYASLITGRGVGLRAKRLAISDLGPVVATEATPDASGTPLGLVTANTDKTNFLKPALAGGKDAMLSLFPSRNWFEDGSE